MVEDERRHGGLRVHHEALREVQADRLGLEQAEEDLLVREVRARRVAEGDAHPPVSALELLADRQVGRIRKPPERAQTRVQHLGERLRALDRERREGVRPDVLAPVLPPGGELPHALTTCQGEEGDEVVHVVPEVIGETETLAGRLPGELEARELAPPRVEDDHRVAGGARPEPAIDTVGSQQPLDNRVTLELLDGRVELERLRIAAGEEPLDEPPRSEEHMSELQSLAYLVCRLLLEKKKKQDTYI